MKQEPGSFPERQQRILEIALTQPFVRVKELAQTIGAHEMTIRRDLQDLSDRGLLERQHGGARLIAESGNEIAYGLRAAQQTQAKARIARAALELIHTEDTIGLDASTSALALAQLLPPRTVNVVTTGLDTAYLLANKGVPFTLAGGGFHAKARSFVGGMASAGLSRLHVDSVFFSAKGFTLAFGFTDAHMPEVEAKEQLIATARCVVALLDHSKFGADAFYQIVPLERVHIVITDHEPNLEIQDAFKTANVCLIVTQEH